MGGSFVGHLLFRSRERIICVGVLDPRRGSISEFVRETGWWFEYLGVMTELEPVSPKIISGKITNRKLDGDNFLPWNIIRVYLMDWGNDYHLTKDPPMLMTNGEKTPCYLVRSFTMDPMFKTWWLTPLLWMSYRIIFNNCTRVVVLSSVPMMSISYLVFYLSIRWYCLT